MILNMIIQKIKIKKIKKNAETKKLYFSVQKKCLKI